MPTKTFPFVMNFWFAIFMTCIMSFVFTVYNTGTITAGAFLSGVWKGFLVSYILGLIIPIGKIGEAVASKTKAKPQSFLWSCISAIVSSVIYDVIMCFAFTFFAIGFQRGFTALLFGGLASVPMGFVVSYPCVVLFTPVAMKLTSMLMKKE